MSLMINSEISKQFLLEEDAIEGFRKAVANNQIRLALQILVEIVDAFMEGFQVLMEEPKEEEVAQNKEQKIDLPAESASKKDEKEPAKPVVKKETKTAE